MSKLRPTLVDARPEDGPGLTYKDTFFRVFEATASHRALVHGRLHGNGESCAIGCYFDENENGVISSRAIDEIAAYNDSFPLLSRHERWKKVRKWLRFKLEEFKGRKVKP